ncbi:alpha/beta fold hydrolase [Streptomyces millisiae]|uniref:Alpha/beta fold hydrolase n=1 Tax=Streptomyces millisiae TaxID=3075542 RepID=A0ABU2M0X8_9ACTN|nr:alpha/beta fold hydrolase [Streptomyces sp. DSM 44918]MDT0323496.1 alpha/beta fold hydrolase [Streptomyces sp. DSM 44918]
MPSTEEQRAEAALAAAEGWPGVRDGETIRTTDVPGMTLAVRRRAGGVDGLEPALLVHGLGGSSRNWSALMEQLTADVECEAIDLPGFGASPPPPTRDYSVYGHARAVIRLLDAGGRAPVHLFGNSLGGAVVTRVAALRPDLVRTLTLIAPAMPERLPRLTSIPTGLVGLPGATRLLRWATRDQPPGRRAREVLRLVYGNPERITPLEFAMAEAEMERRQGLPYFWESLGRSTRGLLNAYTLGGQHSLWRQAERVLAPTLLVYGARDRLVGVASARRASRAFGFSRLVVLPEAGHVAMMEFPAEVAGAFREFLTEAAVAAGDRGEADGRP